MPNHTAQDIVRLDLIRDQRRQIRQAAGRDGEAIELTVEELEERIAPKLASNHNETLLADH